MREFDCKTNGLMAISIRVCASLGPHSYGFDPISANPVWTAKFNGFMNLDLSEASFALFWAFSAAFLAASFVFHVACLIYLEETLAFSFKSWKTGFSDFKNNLVYVFLALSRVILHSSYCSSLDFLLQTLSTASSFVMQYSSRSLRIFCLIASGE